MPGASYLSGIKHTDVRCFSYFYHLIAFVSHQNGGFSLHNLKYRCLQRCMARFRGTYPARGLKRDNEFAREEYDISKRRLTNYFTDIELQFLVSKRTMHDRLSTTSRNDAIDFGSLVQRNIAT